MSLIKFQYRCYLKNGTVYLYMLASLLLLLISFVLGTDYNTLNKTRQSIGNYAINFCEFSFLMYIPAIMIGGFVKDKENKTLSFYKNNGISILRLFMTRNLISLLISVVCNTVALVVYVIINHIPLGIQEFYILSFIILIQVYTILFLMNISLITSTITKAMMGGIIAWITIQILGLAGTRIPILKGRMSLIDGNSRYSDLIVNYVEGKNNTFALYAECLVIGSVWCLLFLLFGMLISKQKKME